MSDESNEIPVLPELLAPLDLDGALITADAMHTRRSTAQWIISRGAHYSGDFTKSFCEAVWEFVAPDEGLECVAGVLEVGALSVADGSLALSPDSFDGVLMGAVGRQVDEMDPLEDVALPQVLPQFLRLVPSRVVPHHDDRLVRVLQGQIGQGLHDVGGVLPVQSHEVHAPVRLVEESDIALGLPFPIDPDPGPGALLAPGPASNGLVLDPHLVRGHHDDILIPLLLISLLRIVRLLVLALILLTRAEIGRASCRERV